MTGLLARHLLALALGLFWAAGAVAHTMPADRMMLHSAAPICATELCAAKAPHHGHAATASCAPACASVACAVLAGESGLVVLAEPSHMAGSRPLSREHLSRPEPYPPRSADLV